MLKISCADYLGPSPAILAQFTFKMCYSRKFQKKSLKQLIFFEEGSRSFKVIDVDILTKLVTSACYDEQHVCAYL